MKILGAGELTRKLVVDGRHAFPPPRARRSWRMGGVVKDSAANAPAASKGAAEAK